MCAAAGDVSLDLRAPPWVEAVGGTSLIPLSGMRVQD